MDSVSKIIAQIYMVGENLVKYVATFMGIMAILWIFQVMRDPKKQFDLAMDLFKKILNWGWRGVLFLWVCVVFVFNMILRVFSVTFATVRDFFMSKN